MDRQRLATDGINLSGRYGIDLLMGRLTAGLTGIYLSS